MDDDFMKNEYGFTLISVLTMLSIRLLYWWMKHPETHCFLNAFFIYKSFFENPAVAKNQW